VRFDFGLFLKQRNRFAEALAEFEPPIGREV